ncbi:MAG TPA: DUF1992 domain-containing protein [Desulfonatronum sp.]|nr:DUF1992 domain-containing protein [Desulfonatronum sp.]
MDSIAFLAEERIKAALQRGEFDTLRGMGRPLVFEDDTMIPPELRMAYKILKNSGHAPPEIEEHKEILSLKGMLCECPDETRRMAESQRLNYLIMMANQRRNRPVHMELDQVYEEKAMRRFRK